MNASYSGATREKNWNWWQCTHPIWALRQVNNQISSRIKIKNMKDDELNQEDEDEHEHDIALVVGRFKGRCRKYRKFRH